MSAIPLAKGAYKRRDNPEIRLVNLMFEADPANTKDQVSLIQRPALVEWKAATGDPCRGMIRIDIGNNPAFFAVMGEHVKGYTTTSFFSLTPDDLPGTQPVTLAGLQISTGTELFIANGTGIYHFSGAGIGAMTFPDSAGVTSVDTLASRVLATRANSGRFYWTPPNTSSFDALDYATAEAAQDDLVRGAVLGDVYWLFGNTSIEPWAPTADADLPFQRISGRVFGIGCISRATIAKTENSILWVGAVERRVYMLNPNPTPVSDPGVEEKLAKATVADLNAFTVDQVTHTLYVLNMGAQGSMALDLTTMQWHEWSSDGAQDFQGRYSAPFGDGRTLCGDTTGRFNFLDPTIHNDNGASISYEFTGLLPVEPRTRIDNVFLDCTVGYAAAYPDNPKIGLRFSDTKGKTWSVWTPAPLGHRGDFRLTPAWKRLGAVKDRDGRLFHWRCSEDLPLTIRAGGFNERI